MKPIATGKDAFHRVPISPPPTTTVSERDLTLLHLVSLGLIKGYALTARGRDLLASDKRHVPSTEPSSPSPRGEGRGEGTSRRPTLLVNETTFNNALRIESFTAHFFRLTVQTLRSPIRTDYVATTRRIVWHLCHELLGLQGRYLANIFGANRNTIDSGLRAIKIRLETYPTTRDRVDALRAALARSLTTDH